MIDYELFHKFKVIPSSVKQKVLGLSYPVRFPTRQTVTHLTEFDDPPIYEMSFKVEDEMEAWKFRALAESFKPDDPMQDIEDSAWENLKNRSSSDSKEPSLQPVYGLECEDSLFEEDEPWNLNRFTASHSIINDFSIDHAPKIPGIQSSFVIIGMLYTWFCLHREDSDLASINFLHSGEPKHWYCVPARERVKLEKLLMKLLNPIYACKTAYLHKCFLLPPEILVTAGIEFTKVIQYPGEIVFTLYGAYHWGFNAGFNVCEATNLASPMYQEIHSKAVNCAKSCFYAQRTSVNHEVLGGLLQRWQKR